MILDKHKLQLILLLVKVIFKVCSKFTSNSDETTEHLKSSSTYLLTMLEAERKRQEHHQSSPRNSTTTTTNSSNNRNGSKRQLSAKLSPRAKNTNYAAYFSGHEIIRYSNLSKTFDKFTVEFWLRIEGGQIKDSTIFHIYNHCALVDLSSITIGLKEYNERKNVGVYFKLRTIGVKKYTELQSHESLSILKWSHVVAVYDGEQMILYINQAKVAVSLQQNGMFLSNIYHKCITLDVGGNAESYATFRGSLDNLKIYDTVKSHRDVAISMNDVTNNDDSDLRTKEGILLREDFNPLTAPVKNKYESVTGTYPELIPVEITLHSIGVKLNTPPCGKTECDNPEIIKNYAEHTSIYRRQKVINYRIIILADDDGDNMLLTKHQAERMDKRINRIFNEYNIVLKLHTVIVRNSFLRQKTVTINCHGHCPSSLSCTLLPQCKKTCSKAQLKNGICNPECNTLENSWDSGDCCNPKYTNITKTCYDPESKSNAFITILELKERLKLDNKNFLTIYPIQVLHTSGYVAKATFPWDADILSWKGGVVINHKSIRILSNDVIHELGHTFGLWHVHKGVSEITNCNDACAETSPSMLTGDLCSDTNPTPRNHKCEATFNYTDSKCGGFKVYQKTPFKNFMGYTPESCVNEFTTQQQARMHCYIDRSYQTWQPGIVAPSPVPTQPQIRSSKENNVVEIIWAPPLGYGKRYFQNKCWSCHSNHKIKQYAESAFYTNGKHFSHKIDEVLGLPDAVKCPPLRVPHNAMYPSSRGDLNNAYLQVSFKRAVIPTALKVWVIQNAENAIKDLVLVHDDNTTTSLGHATMHCDTPYTRRIKTHRNVTKLQIHFHAKILRRPGIDAVQLISQQIIQRNQQQQLECIQCKKLRFHYIVSRQPPFKRGICKGVKGLRFVDYDTRAGQRYSYTVRAVSGCSTSVPSPPLFYRSTDGFCGDGIIDGKNGEQCDDGNLRDGDGCNVECRIEAVFDCQLQPSLCYRYDRDGVCEEHERSKMSRDCIYSTPKGFIDQWSIRVTGMKGQSDGTCPEAVIAGKPPDNLKCSLYSSQNVDPTEAWLPCNGIDPATGDLLYNGWIEADFQNSVYASAVVLYFMSDGRWSTNAPNRTISIKLKDIQQKYHTISKTSIPINCANNPTIINVGKINHVVNTNKKRQPFKTISVRVEFEIGYMAFAGIALRSRKDDCMPNEHYNEETLNCEGLTMNDPIPCRKLTTKHSKINCSEDGDRCNVTCNHGYVPKHSFMVYCKNGEWTYNISTCKPIQCSKLQIEHATTRCVKRIVGDIVGAVCSFSCNADTYLYGSDTKVTCQSNGRWSQQKSFCYKVCPKLPRVESALIASCAEDGKSATIRREQYAMGTRCRFQCLKGYKSIRKSNIVKASSGDIVNLHCNGFGQWIKDSTCQPIECPKLSRMYELLYNCTNRNRDGSICKTTCFGVTKEITIQCLNDGTWSSPIDVCPVKGKCERFPLVEGIDTTSCIRSAFGSSCKPKCKKNGVDMVIKFGRDRKYINADVIFYCMPNSKWWPPPQKTLSCKRKCFTWFSRNKYCDCYDNREHCNYDNGACCGDNVKYRRFHRGPKCGCVDPKFIRRRKKKRR